MTVQSESKISQRTPNQSAVPSTTADATVRTPLYHVLNRLARTHPATPFSERGGGNVGPKSISKFADIDSLINKIYPFKSVRYGCTDYQSASRSS